MNSMYIWWSNFIENVIQNVSVSAYCQLTNETDPLLITDGIPKKCHIIYFLYSLYNNKPSTNVGREIIHWCCLNPTTFFHQEFFTAFLSLKCVGKRKRAKDKENYIIPLTKTILCEKLKALNPYQNKYFICLSEFKHFDIVWQLFLGLQGIIGHRNTSIDKIQLTIIYCNKM